MNKFSIKSINREWVKNISFEEFKEAHAHLGCSDSELEDAYAQVKSIITPQEEVIDEPVKLQENGIGNTNDGAVEKTTSKRNSRRSSNKQSQGDSKPAEGSNE